MIACSRLQRTEGIFPFQTNVVRIDADGAEQMQIRKKS